MNAVTPEQDAAAQRRKVLALADAIKDIAATVAGYRKQLIDGGVSEETAEQMTLQLHEAMMVQMRTPQSSAGG